MYHYRNLCLVKVWYFTTLSIPYVPHRWSDVTGMHHIFMVSCIHHLRVPYVNKHTHYIIYHTILYKYYILYIYILSSHVLLDRNFIGPVFDTMHLIFTDHLQAFFQSKSLHLLKFIIDHTSKKDWLPVVWASHNLKLSLMKFSSTSILRVIQIPLSIRHLVCNHHGQGTSHPGTHLSHLWRGDGHGSAHW